MLKHYGAVALPCRVQDHGADHHHPASVGNATPRTGDQLAQNAGWNDELLQLELNALRTEALHLDVIGFDEEELDCLIREQEQIPVTCELKS